MITMFLICGGLATIIVVVHLSSAYLTRWLIRTDIGKALSVIYSNPDQQLKENFSYLSKKEIVDEIVILHYKLHNAMKNEKFSHVDMLNREIFAATCRFTDIIAQEIKNENSSHI